MTKKRPTLTIGIPAFNEAANIASLLGSLLSQRQVDFELSNIIVYSDASTDGTQKEVMSVNSELVSLSQSSTRIGKPVITNFIFSHSNTDIVVVLDADIQIKSSSFIEELVLPIVNGQADLTSGKITELNAITFIEKVLKTSMEVKRELFESYKHGANIYTCHGRSRAFSRRFYTSFTALTQVAADDAYSYLSCKQLGFVYQYTPKAVLQYRLPQTLRDHLRQSNRFFQGNQQLLRYVKPEVVGDAFALPLSLQASTLAKFLVTQPLHFVFYIGILVYSKLQSLISPTITSTWNIATSSKVLK